MATGPAIPRLGKQDEGRLVSSEDFAEAEFDEPWKYERAAGRLIVTAPSGEGHSNVSEPWRDHLGAYRLAHPEVVQRVASEAWVRVDGGTDRIGDIGVYLSRPDLMPPRPDRVPDLIFEVVSRDKKSRDRDYVEKRAEYHRLGVREYVIIDRFEVAVTVLSWTPEGYVDNILDADDVYSSPLLPGLAHDHDRRDFFLRRMDPRAWGPTMATGRTILRLGKQDEGRLVSSEEFAEAEFDEPWTYEREGGRLIALAPAGEDHLVCSDPWRDRLIFYRYAHPNRVQKVVSEAWLRVDGGTDRIGDIGVYLVPEGPVPRIPDRVPELMFEVVSPEKASRDRDYIAKRADYHRSGVREYVIIDRFRKVVTVLSLAPECYRERILNVGDSHESPLLPGLAIPLAEVFP